MPRRQAMHKPCSFLLIVSAEKKGQDIQETPKAMLSLGSLVLPFDESFLSPSAGLRGKLNIALDHDLCWRFMIYIVC
jgi:hypothetical protein